MSCKCKCETFKKAVNTVRMLSADGVEAANSGHPGMPMGCADYAFTLWSDFLRFNPEDPQWIGRDRFVLSAGHGSMLIYSLLHLFEYGLTIDDLKQFRQWGSKCPGHPEYGHTRGVEVTTGPLASGLASAVGMAIGMKQFQAQLGGCDCLFDQKVYVISGDGCIMEGTSHEACALAGHLKLDNLILFYDDNDISIEGSTDIAMSEDVPGRFEAYGWNIIRIEGNCVSQIRAAIQLARGTKGKPTMIVGATKIGKGAATMEGSEATHGAPLGAEELAATKTKLGFDPTKSFVVDEDVRGLIAGKLAEKKTQYAEWNAKFETFKAGFDSEKAALFTALTTKAVPANLKEELMKAVPEKATATRNSGGVLMQKVAELVPSLTGGSADLNPSTKTYLKGLGDFSATDRAGRNIHFGVRELGMGLIANGLALAGYAIPFSSTFMVFSDYMKPAMRLAAIQNLHEVFVFTHDSIFVGEDGPTHQPIEQLAMFRTIPGMTVIRPAESNEAAQAWAAAMEANGPVILCMTRQTVPNLPKDIVENRMDVAKGAYVVTCEEGFEVIIIATGSEVSAALGAAEQLRAQGKKVRVVSMPSWELFEKQSAEYKESVLPSCCTKRVAVEAGTTFGWQRYVGQAGLVIGIDHFGASAPAEKLAAEYGFTADGVAKRVAEYLK